MRFDAAAGVTVVVLSVVAGMGGLAYGQTGMGAAMAAQGSAQYGPAGPPPGEGQMGQAARPGAVNYVEGQVQMEGRALSSRSVGSAVLEVGQTLETHVGRAEILLTPGVFLRVGNNSVVKMVSPDLVHTEVQLVSGKVDVEVDQIYKHNNLLIDQGPAQTRLLKTGFYAFNTVKNTMRVFEGEAAVYPLNGADEDKRVVVKGGHKLVLDGETTKTVRFNKTQSQDGLYAWSSLRSDYLGAANESVATEYAGVEGTNPGWLWDPAFAGYTWLPGGGMQFSPFGFGFYSPYYIEGGGLIYGRGGYGGFYGGGYYGRGGYIGRRGYVGRGGYAGRGGYVGRGGYGPGGHRSVHPGMGGGGFRDGGGGGFHGGGGGGFHGGGGGFHGGAGGSRGGGGGHAGGGGHR